MTFAAILLRSRTEREDWQYTDLKPFAALALQKPKGASRPALPAPLAAARLVFVDGLYDPASSTLADVSSCLSVSEKAEGLFIQVEAQTCLAVMPVELLFVTTDQDEPTEVSTTLTVALGQNARLNLIEHHVQRTQTTPSASTVALAFVLAPQSKLVHGKIVAGGASALHFAQTTVSVADGAFYDHFGLISGGRLTRCESEIILGGPLAEARLLGATLLRGSAHADKMIRITHAAPHGTSRQIYKTVLDEKARGVFQGKVIVNPGASKTDGYQLSRALLLSDKAEMDAKPELEIYNDDVKCSHGSTVGELDEAALFYLRARGIPEPEARALLIAAFVNELVDQIQVEELQKAVRAEVEKWLSRT